MLENAYLRAATSATGGEVSSLSADMRDLILAAHRPHIAADISLLVSVVQYVVATGMRPEVYEDAPTGQDIVLDSAELLGR